MCLHSIPRILIPLTVVVISGVCDASIENGNILHELLHDTPHCGSKLDKTGLCLLENNCNKSQTLTDSCTISVSIKSFGNMSTQKPTTDILPSDNDHNHGNQPTALEAWIYGILSAIMISLSGIVGCVLSPLITGSYQQHVLNTLIGLSFGSLTSAALLQLIPEAYNFHKILPDYMNTGMFTVITIWVLYVIQTLSGIIFNDDKMHGKDVANHNHNHAHLKHCFHAMKNNTINKVSSEERNAVACYYDQDNNHQEVNVVNNKEPFDSRKKLYIVSEIEGSAEKSSKGRPSSLAWMIILGDGFHNFLDGISIGAAYTQNLRVGLSVTLAIACEEYPHELGDFAILIQSGLSVKRAALYNYLSATSIIIGVAVGIVLGELKFSSLIFSSSAGLFLYIALGNLMSELRNMIKTALSRHRKYSLLMLLLQNIGFLTAFIALVYIIPANSHR